MNGIRSPKESIDPKAVGTWLLVICFILAFIGCGCSESKRLAYIERQQMDPIAVAVVIENHPSDAMSGEIVGNSIEEFLLNNFPAIDIAERQRIDMLIAEENLQRSNIFNPKTAKRLGDKLRVDALIVGRVTHWKMYTERRYRQYYRQFGSTETDNDCEVGFTFSMIDVGTGRKRMSLTVSEDEDSYAEAIEDALDDDALEKIQSQLLRKSNRKNEARESVMMME